MEQEFDDILDFNPENLTIFNESTSVKGGNENIYKPKPENSKSDDHVYRSQIKVIYNPFDLKNSVLERQSYWIQDDEGGFEVVSSLTNGDKSCPIFNAWKKCHYSKDRVLQLQAESKLNGGKQLFDKRYSRMVVIQVLNDNNDLSLNGRYMFWKCPRFIWDMIQSKMKPSTESKKCPIPVLDFLFGKAIDLEITPGNGPVGSPEYKRDTSYKTSELTEDVMSCINPDGSSLLTSDQQDILDNYVSEMKKIWKEKDPVRRSELMNEVNAMENTKQLRTFYRDIIEKIKTYCPNIKEELGFKPWSEDIKKRVEKWISVVLSGKDPSVDSANIASSNGEINNNTNDDPFASDTSDADDDLPF